MKGYILALDQGTTSSRALVFNEKGEKLACCQKEFEQIFVKSGWVEHDPRDIWESQLEVARGAINKAGLQPSDISAIGVTNQRETTIIWDKATGEPVYNAIVWQCRRTADMCAKFTEQGLEKFSATKQGSLSTLTFLLQRSSGYLTMYRARAKERSTASCFLAPSIPG